MLYKKGEQRLHIVAHQKNADVPTKKLVGWYRHTRHGCATEGGGYQVWVFGFGRVVPMGKNESRRCAACWAKGGVRVYVGRDSVTAEQR